MERTILLVEDDRTLHHFVSHLLGSHGHRVISAYDAREGLELLDRENVDLALLDVMMPGMDGLEMLQRVRESDRSLPVIIMTAHATPEAGLRALRGHAWDFLEKPFTVEDLLSAVGRALREDRSQQRIQVLSAKPDWIELRVPCDLSIVEPLERILAQMDADLSRIFRENIAFAFKELLRNAIEHGGKNDPDRYVEVGHIRTPSIILYRIKDPGEGFSPHALRHAAISNREGDATAHLQVRDEMGMRAGGFGILIARQMVDEVIYNEAHNEVILIKYRDGRR